MASLFGARPPSDQEVGLPKRDAARLPLHCKPVGCTIDYAAVNQLSCNDPIIKGEWTHSVGWCTDPSRYGDVVLNACRRTRMTQRDLDMMRGAGTIRTINIGEIPRAYCDIFAVAEWAKQRRRRVVNPVPVNTACGRDTLRVLRLSSRKTIRQVAFRGSHVACVDAASFFDQFGIDPQVGLYFCFRGPDDNVYCLTSMAMGQRQSTEVASALMHLIAAFDHPDVHIDIATDNIRFVGSQEDVTTALRTFSRRCDSIGVVLNELPRDAAEDLIQATVVTTADFLGEVIDYTSKTVSCRQKVIDRAIELWALRSTWTNRQQVGHTAVLMWCSSPLRIPLLHRYKSLAFLRKQGRDLFFEPTTWDSRATIPDEVMKDLAEWHRTVTENEPTAIEEPGQPDDFYIFTDASLWGWGAIWLGIAADSMQIAQMPWGDSLPGAEHSTVAEPEAVWRALCRFIRPNDTLNVCIVSDHDPFVAAINRGHSAAAGNNGVLMRIAQRFPNVKLRAQFMKGASNPADEISRKLSSPEAEDRARHGVRDILGSVRQGPQAVTPTIGSGSPLTQHNEDDDAVRAKRCEAAKGSRRVR